ncbi:MAG: hypothetical protein ACREEE_16050 [Dongiaceae bacterium]
MKSLLFIAGLVGFLTMISPAAMAGGPGRHLYGDTPAGPSQESNQPRFLKIQDDDSWNFGFGSPWPYYYQPYLNPRSNRYGNGYYGSPGWGYPYGDNYYYKPKRLTERQVVSAVRGQHFRKISKVWFDDGVYKVRAIDYYGRRVLLLVDPYSGRIVRWSFRR